MPTTKCFFCHKAIGGTKPCIQVRGGWLDEAERFVLSPTTDNAYLHPQCYEELAEKGDFQWRAPSYSTPAR